MLLIFVKTRTKQSTLGLNWTRLVLQDNHCSSLKRRYHRGLIYFVPETPENFLPFVSDKTIYFRKRTQDKNEEVWYNPSFLVALHLLSRKGALKQHETFRRSLLLSSEPASKLSYLGEPRSPLARAFSLDPGGGGGGTPIYGLYRYVPWNRVWFFKFSVLK